MSDTYFDNVSLLLHFNGNDGDTNIIDSSANNLLVYPNGNVKLSNSLYKYGTASAIFDGNGDYLYVTDDKLAISNYSNFTFECWIYLKSAPVNRAGIFFFGDISTYDNYITWFIFSNRYTYFSRRQNGYLSEAGGGQIPLNQWVHLAFVKTGTNYRAFIAGILDLEVNYEQAINYTPKLYIGSTRNSSTIYNQFNGNIDDLRVTSGVARYTLTFTPPTSEFPNSGTHKLIIQGSNALNAPKIILSQLACNIKGNNIINVPNITASQSFCFLSCNNCLSIPEIISSLGVRAWLKGNYASGLPNTVANFGYLTRLQAPASLGTGQALGHFGYLSILQAPDAVGTPQATAFALPAVATDIPQAITYYYAKLTGDADGLTDVTLPMSSFSVRHRYDGPSYYQLTIPTYAYVSQIAARPNGEIVIWSKTGDIEEELLRGDPGNVRTDRGPNSQSISISGNSERAATNPVTYLLAEALYASTTFEGESRLRIPPRAAIRPGDFIRYADLNFQVGEVAWSVAVSLGGMAITMEVSSLPVDA